MVVAITRRITRTANVMILPRRRSRRDDYKWVNNTRPSSWHPDVCVCRRSACVFCGANILTNNNRFLLLSSCVAFEKVSTGLRRIDASALAL